MPIPVFSLCTIPVHSLQSALAQKKIGHTKGTATDFSLGLGEGGGRFKLGVANRYIGFQGLLEFIEY